MTERNHETPSSFQISFHRGAPTVSVELLRSTEEGSKTTWAEIKIGAPRFLVFNADSDADLRVVQALRDACDKALAKREAANG